MSDGLAIGILNEIHEILNHRPYASKNSSSWLDEDLRTIYENTVGPAQSPDPVECFILNKLAGAVMGNVLEIGSWRGRSSCFIAHAIKNSGGNRKLYCIDWFKGDTTGGENPDLKIMKDRLDFFGLTSFVDVFSQDMLDFDYSNLSNIDLVFYDSDHNTKPTTRALRKIHPVINKNAILCIHDAYWEMTKNAILNVSGLYRKLTTINVWQGFAILIKKTTNHAQLKNGIYRLVGLFVSSLLWSSTSD